MAVLIVLCVGVKIVVLFATYVCFHISVMFRITEWPPLAK